MTEVGLQVIDGELTTTPSDPVQVLSAFERMFVSEYMKDLHGPDALRRMNRGGKNPSAISRRILARPHVRADIDKRLRAAETATQVTVERIRDRYAEIAFAAVKGPVLHSHVLQALDRLGNHLGMFRPESQTQVAVQFVLRGRDDDAIEHDKPKPMILIDKQAKGS